MVRGKTPFVEIQAKKTDDYCTFVRKAAKIVSSERVYSMCVIPT